MFGDHLKSLHLNVVSLLYRLPYEVGLLDSPSYRCGKHLSDIDGLPLNASGWIPPSPRKAGGGDKVANGKPDEAMDVDDEEKNDDEKGEKGDDKEGKEKVDEDKKDDDKDAEKDSKAAEAAEEAKDGRWVAWHASCRTS